MKPILIIWIPTHRAFLRGHGKDNIYSLMHALQEHANEQSAGAHTIICLPSGSRDDIEVECFHTDNVKPADLQPILDAIEDYKKSLSDGNE
jgi:hypothetical protein